MLTDDFQDGNNSECHDDCWAVKDWSAGKGTRSSLSMVMFCLMQTVKDMIILFLYFLVRGNFFILACSNRFGVPLKITLFWLYFVVYTASNFFNYLAVEKHQIIVKYCQFK